MNILILLGILAVFVVLMNFASKYTFITGKRMYWILGTYIAILLVSTVFFFTVVEKKASGEKPVDMDQFPNLEDVLYGEKALEEITPYIAKQETLFYDLDKLFIQVGEINFMNMPILISREDEDTNEIEATIYQTPLILEGLDITEYMSLVELSFTDEVLTLYIPFSSQDLDLDVYKNNFPVRQFTGEKLFDDGDRGGYSHASQLLHLAIPKGIDLDVEEGVWVNYIME